MNKHKFPYEWTLKDANFTKDKGTVFSCFACGGGSTMGYKLAGFDVIGCNEIDPKMMDAYRTNHKPKFSYLEPIQTFKLRKDLPKELYNLDILDGSPPCSSFSMAGNREKDWGKDKKFREGQAEQVLDTLFFDFIDLAKELQPKVVVAENVSGLMMGSAKEYVIKIHKAFLEAGYQLKIEPYLLDSSTMGVPQRRKRVFFTAIRNDISEQFMENVDMFQVAPHLDLTFKEKEIPVKVFAEFEDKKETVNYCENRFGDVILDMNRAANTITSGVRFWLNEKQILKEKSYSLIGSYPTDYKFNSNSVYMIGMSVPPVMVAQISTKIHEQWLSKLNPL
jgi:DNA (cytosine-5)-methyltransferase 1